MTGTEVLSVDPAGPDDLADVLRLTQQLHRTGYPIDPAVAEKNWQRLLTSDLTDVLIGRLGGEAVSTCILIIVPNLTWGGAPYALIENVVTDTGHRGKGFGKATMQAAVERARQAGCYKVMLMTGRKEEWVLRFYESCGFDRHAKTAFQFRLEA